MGTGQFTNLGQICSSGFSDRGPYTILKTSVDLSKVNNCHVPHNLGQKNLPNAYAKVRCWCQCKNKTKKKNDIYVKNSGPNK